MKFQGKTVVITGASSGIGRALAYEFSSVGANVVLGARQEGELKVVADDIASKGGQAAYIATDVTREEDCKKLATLQRAYCILIPHVWLSTIRPICGMSARQKKLQEKTTHSSNGWFG